MSSNSADPRRYSDLAQVAMRFSRWDLVDRWVNTFLLDPAAAKCPDDLRRAGEMPRRR